MTSRSRFIGLFFSICLWAGCASGLGAGTNEQKLPAPASTMGGGLGSNQLFLARPAETNDPKLDSGQTLGPNDGISVTVYQEEDLRYYLSHAVAVSNDSPVLLDRFLNDAIEVDIDAICDGKEVLIGAIMEHIEQAGIHSGDSACT